MNQIWNLRKNCPVGAIPKPINCKLCFFLKEQALLYFENNSLWERSLLFSEEPYNFHYFARGGKFPKHHYVNYIQQGSHIFFPRTASPNQCNHASTAPRPLPGWLTLPSRWFSCPLPRFPHQQTGSSGDQLNLLKPTEAKAAVPIVSLKLNKLFVSS